MHVQADEPDVWVADQTLCHIQEGLDVEPELDPLDTGVGFDVRLGRQIGVHAQGDGSAMSDRACHFLKGFQLGITLNVE